MRYLQTLIMILSLYGCVKSDGGGDQVGKINISTSTVSAITTNSAITGGTVNSDGGSPVIERGICYATTPLPTLANIRVNGGSGLGSFQVNLENLTPDTKYYFRAYAFSATDTSYGNHLEFRTEQLLPRLTTNSVSAITTANAGISSTVVSAGGSPITQRGVCWATTAGPTIANDKTSDGSGLGLFTSQVTGLRQNTRYFVRAYATNSFGTEYGNELTFVTPLPTTEDLNQIQFLDNNTGFIAGNKIILKTTNGGDTWIRIRESATIEFTSIHFSNSSVGYAGGNDQYYAYIYKTNDGGLSWSQLAKWWNSNEPLRVNAIHATGLNNITCLVNSRPNATQMYGFLYSSSDGGANWNKRSMSSPQGFNCADLSNGTLFIGGNAYMSGTSNRLSVYTSTFHTNNSLTISPTLVDGTGSMFGLQMLGSKGYAVGTEGKFFTSGDGGLNWSTRALNGYTAQTLTGVHFVDQLKGYIIGTNGLLLRTIDGGFDWFKETTNTTEGFRGLAIKPDGILFAVGTKGEIFRNKY